MNFSFHPEAEKEFNQAIDYYEDLQENLGLEFAQEIFDVIQRIIELLEKKMMFLLYIQ